MNNRYIRNGENLVLNCKRMISGLLCCTIILCSSPVTVLADTKSMWDNIKDKMQSECKCDAFVMKEMI